MDENNDWIDAPPTGEHPKPAAEREAPPTPQPKKDAPAAAPKTEARQHPSLLKRLRWQLVMLGVGLVLIAGAGFFFIFQQVAGGGGGETPPEITLTGDQQFVEVMVGEPAFVNPLLATSQVDTDLSRLVFSGLTRVDEFGQPVPDLAESWSVSEDGLTYIFTLRSDATWHDGEPVTAEDVAFTFELLRDPDFPGPLALSQFWQTVETYADDTATVRFVLTQPLTAFPEYAGIGILPEHWLGGVPVEDLPDDPFNLDPIGSGRLDWTGIETAEGSTRVSLQPYADFYDDDRAIVLDAVNFVFIPNANRAFSALGPEALALGGLSAPQLDAVLESKSLHVYTGRLPAYKAIVFNQTQDDLIYFQEPEVRTALALGLERAALVSPESDTMLIATDSPILPGTWAYNPSLPTITYSPDAATQQLDAAEWFTQGGTRTRDEVRMSFTLLTTNTPTDEAIGQVVREQWEALGVDVTVESVRPEAFISRLEGRNFDAALVEYSQGGIADPDPYAFWHDSQIEAGQNFSGVNDREISEMLEIARKDPNGVRRAELYRAFQRRFIEQGIAIPLFNPAYHYAVSCQVTGVEVLLLSGPADRFRNMHEWRIATQDELSEVCP